MPGTLISRRQVGSALAKARTAFERGNLLAQLSPRHQHGPDDRRQIVAVGQQLLNASIKWKPPHRARQQAKRLQHAPDMV